MTTHPPAPQLTPPPARWPWQRSLQYRIIFAYGAVILVVLTIFTVWIGQVVYQANLSSAEHDLEVTAFLASNVLEDPLSGYTSEFDQFKKWEEDREQGEDGHSDDEEGESATSAPPPPVTTTRQQQAIVLPRLQQVATVYAGDAGARVTILDTQGNVLADSHHLAMDVVNQGKQIEFQTALAGAERSEIRPDDFTGAPTIFAAAPVQQGDQILGVVQISKPVDEATADARRILFSLAGASLIALAVSTLLAVWIGRRLVRPVRELEAAAIAVAQGDLTQTVTANSSDELGALARAFNRMVDEVRSLLAQQRIFVANASHELRTPLTNIKLRSEAVRTLGNEDPALSARYLAEIDSEADRLTRLANDLLDLAQLEEHAGQQQQPAAAVDVTPVLLAAAEVMQLQATQAAITLAVDVSPNLPCLHVNADHVEEIIVNLLDNAIKYTPANGQVKLTTRVANAQLEICVEDNGPGIPPEDLPHIFDRFYRVDKVRSRRKGIQNTVGSGAGLGLSIVRQLVEQNGGQIRVELAPVQGAVFVVSFPAMA